MPEPLVPPEFQYCDANGAPLAGGTIDTFVPGTDTPANTWSDMAGTALNTNPVVLDSAGRALIYGSGEYRFVLKDASGNLIYDQLTTSFISDAMKPVVQADSISDALDVLGVTDAIQTETDRAMAAEGALTTSGSTTDSNLAAEIARAEAAEGQLNSQLGGGAFQSGLSTTNSSGYDAVTFPRPYTTADDPFVMLTPWYGGLVSVTLAVETAPNGFTVWAADATGAGVGIGYLWMSYGTPP